MKKLILSFVLFFLINHLAWSQCPSDCSGFNTRLGNNAGASLTSGGFNTFIGRFAGEKNTSGNNNTFLGDFAGRNTTTGNANTFLGEDAGRLNTIGYDNAFIGTDAGLANTEGFANVFLGKSAGLANTKGAFNIFIGKESGRSNTTGNANLFVGLTSGEKNTTGYGNVFLGHRSGISNTTGAQNIFIGGEAGLNNTLAGNNVFIGQSAGYENTLGTSNVFLGNFTGYNNTTGGNNTYLGGDAGRNNNGSFNTFVGNNAGTNNFTGSGNTLIGYRAGYYESGSNKLYIDNTDTDKPLIYGDFSTNIVAVNGALGVGIQKPERPIHLRASNAIFRIDRDSDDPGFAIVRYDAGFANVWKSFYFYTKGSGVNTGKFVIADWGTNVSGPSTPRFVIANNGNVGIGDYLVADPSQKLTVSGNVLATGSFITSDKRFKKNIQTIPSAMDRLSQINGVTYAFETQKFAGKGLPEGQALGLIAQEVEKVFPELVVEDAEGFKAVNYDGLIPVLIEALKAQKQISDAQEERIKQLEDKLTKVSQTNNQTTSEAKKSAELFQNQPNPFDQSTLIRYFLPENTTQAMMIITDLQGKEVNRQILTGRGENSLKIEAASLAKGIYLYTLIADGQVIDTKKMWLSE